MSGRNKSKAKINMTKPDLPPFLQRMKEQIVANEDAERKERSERKRKDRPSSTNDSLDDDPTIVKLNDDDLTEEEYKRMKKGEYIMHTRLANCCITRTNSDSFCSFFRPEMETQYKLDSDGANKAKPSELDVDSLIQTIQEDKTGNATAQTKSPSRATEPSNRKQSTSSSKQKPTKKLSYGSSDDEDSD